jgi:hAT family C-terminal dimerisation region
VAPGLLVVRDNIIRWNSTYLSIHRALKLQPHLKLFVEANRADLRDDELTEQDWDILRATAQILYLFWNITKRLEGHAKNGERGAMWESIPAVEVLIEHLDKMKQIYTQETHPELATSINLAWSKLDNYYKKLDDSPAYAAALLLHPRYRLRYFDNKWKGQLRKYLAPMKKATRAVYDEFYAPQSTLEEEEEEEQVTQQPDEDEDCLGTYLDGDASQDVEDEFKHFISAEPTYLPQEKVYSWWSEQNHIPHVRQMAYDLLSIPAMSAETERVFSDINHTITPNRMCLGAEVVEAEKCL